MGLKGHWGPDATGLHVVVVSFLFGSARNLCSLNPGSVLYSKTKTNKKPVEPYAAWTTELGLGENQAWGGGVIYMET